MSWRIVDSSVQAAWVAATSQTTQLEGLRDAIGSSPRFAALGGSGELARVTVPTPTINTSTDPYQLEITGFVPGSHVHTATGNPVTAEVRTSGGTVILRADAGLADSGATVEFGDPAIPGSGSIKALCPPSAGLVVRADGSLPAEYIPAWRDPAAAAVWVEIPVAVSYDSLSPHLDASINPLYPSHPEYMSSGAFSWRTRRGAWNAYCYDRATDEILDYLSGGHGDYAGNDAIRGRLWLDEIIFNRVSLPTGWNGAVLTNDQARLVSGSGTTVVLPAGTQAPLLWDGSRDEASAEDDAYNGMILSAFGRANRTITDYDGDTRTATVSPAFDGDMAGVLFSISNGPMVMGLLGEKSGKYADGRPRSVHTYNIPCLNTITGNPWMVVGGSGFSWTASQSSFAPVEFDRVTGEPTFHTAPTSAQAASPLGAAVAFDPTRGSEGSFWYLGQNAGRLMRYDCAADTWHETATTSVRGGEQCLTYLPGHDLLLCGGTGSPWQLYDPAANTWHTITVTGTTAGGNTSYGKCSPEYVPADDAVYWWHHATETTRINCMVIPEDPKADTWTITLTTPHEDNEVTPTAALTNGTFGAFRYSPRLDAFILINALDGPVYAYLRAPL